MKGKGTNRRKKVSVMYCPNSPHPEGLHIYSSRMKRNGGPWIRICSWCLQPEPGQKDKT